MQGISWNALLLFGAAFVGQIIGVNVLPRTLGFTNATYTLVCLLAFDISLLFCARLLATGVSLAILIPLMSAFVPLTSIVVGVFLYGQGASLLKVTLLVVACGLVGMASRLQ
jgi:multidrug transporter EmrE-like cation transporter